MTDTVERVAGDRTAQAPDAIGHPAFGPLRAGAAEAWDVVICGGGYVGLSLGLALRRAAPSLSVLLVDARPPAAPNGDLRASAIAAAARRMLETLGVWAAIEPESQPILDMVVTDSRLEDAVRPVFLTFAGTTERGEPFAHMVPNGVLVEALRRAALEAGLVIRAPERVADYAAGVDGAEVRLGSGARIAASLIVAADGVRSHLRGLAGIRTLEWRYGQSGIVATVAHEHPHEGRAEEHFLPAGPFAILPLKGNRSSLVWTERTDVAERLVADDEIVFVSELERRFGRRLGAIELVGGRAAFPLGLVLARDFVKRRLALVGDAAHGIHPIAGQGLNLGFRDVAALAEAVVEAIRIGEEPGSDAALARYQRWRRFDTVQMALVTDGLNRLFSNDIAPLRMLRDVGLGIVDRLPGLKRMFIAEAAGEARSAPRLLRGLAI